MQRQTYEIESSATQTCWAELDGRRITIHRKGHTSSGEDEVLLGWDVDVLRNLLSWAAQETAVAAYFEGPMAHQIREHSRELAMTPEMFVWNAVKLFIEVGAGQ